MFRYSLGRPAANLLAAAILMNSFLPLLNSAEVAVALTPANFPSHSDKDVTAMFKLGKELGDYAMYIYQWGQPDFKEVAKNVVAASKASGLKPILSISPTRLEGRRDELDVPSDVRRKAGRNLTFRDKNVHLPFIEDALELARLKPPYLCLATEINMLAFKDIKEYLAFAHVYKKVYAEIKKISPDTKVFVSFQWDFFHIMDEREPGKIEEHSKLIDVFRPELDVVAFTSYPAAHFKTPADVPADYYTNVTRHTKPSDEIAFTEIGWPSKGKGSDGSQEQFIKRLPQLLSKLKVSIVAWPLLHDVKTNSFGEDLSTTGLLTRSGEQKPGYRAFQQMRRELRR
ncbi:MAG TPA: hypothetical protein VEQ63_07690 [Bryobacteraceae bacterium]|nr:hypothetical protein [Bryobacteraceae bacterium]